MKLELIENDLNTLHSNVTNFLADFTRCTNQTITFKFHFMLRYKKFIESYVPIWIYYTLRSERMHQTLMSLVNSSMNSVNLPKQIIRGF